MLPLKACGVVLAVLLLSIEGSWAQPLDPVYLGCRPTQGFNLAHPLPVLAPLGSYDFRTAVFQPDFSPLVPITGIGCSQACRASGLPVSGLSMTGVEGAFQCFCGVAWTSIPPAGSICMRCSESNSTGFCPNNTMSLAVYVHTPSFSPVATPRYGMCYSFTESESMPQAGGVSASRFTSGPSEVAQASTCIAQCALHGHRVGGIATTNQCWCFTVNPSPGRQVVTCDPASCLLSLLASQNPDGTFDGFNCGGLEQLALYGLDGPAPDVSTSFGGPSDPPLNRTVGDPVDGPFTCTGTSPSHWFPVEVVWAFDSVVGANVSTPSFAQFRAQSTLTLSGTYDGGMLSYHCVVTSPSNNDDATRVRSSAIYINVYSVPTGEVVETGVPAVGESFNITCKNGGNGTAVDFSWTGASTSSNAVLTFPSASAADEGNYTCSFTIQETGRMGSIGHTVVIYARPVVNFPDSLVQAIGDMLTCSDFIPNYANRLSVLRFEWLVPPVSMRVAGNSIQTTVGGTYRCTATNTVLQKNLMASGTVRESEDTVTITTLGAPVAIVSVVGVGETAVHRAIANSDGYVVLPGGSANINCSEEIGRNVSFLFETSTGMGASRTNSTENTTSLALSMVGSAQDGLYSCLVTDGRIQSASRTTATTISFDVFFTPVLDVPSTTYAIIGERYVLPCSFIGDTPDNFTWTRAAAAEGGQATVEASSRDLVFESVARSDSASYTCQIAGRVSSTLPVYGGNATVSLTAQAAPSATISAPSSTVIAVGASVSVSCTAGGDNPSTAEISWLRNGVAVLSSGQNTLTRSGASLTLEILEFSNADVGMYTCRVFDPSIGIESRRTVTSVVTLESSGSSEEQKSGSNTTTIIIAVVCGVVGLLLLILLIVIIYRQRKGKKTAGESGQDNPTYAPMTTKTSTVSKNPAPEGATQGSVV